MVWLVLREARLPIARGRHGGFGGIISEIGGLHVVGGNIKGRRAP